MSHERRLPFQPTDEFDKIIAANNPAYDPIRDATIASLKDVEDHLNAMQPFDAAVVDDHVQSLNRSWPYRNKMMLVRGTIGRLTDTQNQTTFPTEWGEGFQVDDLAWHRLPEHSQFLSNGIVQYLTEENGVPKVRLCYGLINPQDIEQNRSPTQLFADRDEVEVEFELSQQAIALQFEAHNGHLLQELDEVIEPGSRNVVKNLRAIQEVIVRSGFGREEDDRTIEWLCVHLLEKLGTDKEWPYRVHFSGNYIWSQNGSNHFGTTGEDVYSQTGCFNGLYISRDGNGIGAIFDMPSTSSEKSETNAELCLPVYSIDRMWSPRDEISFIEQIERGEKEVEEPVAIRDATETTTTQSLSWFEYAEQRMKHIQHLRDTVLKDIDRMYDDEESAKVAAAELLTRLRAIVAAIQSENVYVDGPKLQQTSVRQINNEEEIGFVYSKKEPYVAGSSIFGDRGKIADVSTQVTEYSDEEGNFQYGVAAALIVQRDPQAIVYSPNDALPGSAILSYTTCVVPLDEDHHVITLDFMNIRAKEDAFMELAADGPSSQGVLELLRRLDQDFQESTADEGQLDSEALCEVGRLIDQLEDRFNALVALTAMLTQLGMIRVSGIEIAGDSKWEAMVEGDRVVAMLPNYDRNEGISQLVLHDSNEGAHTFPIHLITKLEY